MVESATNMNKHTVVIPTAGIGSRTGEIGKHLNKSLLPYLDKPVLAHIIDQFPADTKFFIPVGYNAQQVCDFCTLAYSDRDIEFIPISEWTGPHTGPGFTVKHLLPKIDGPFWYIPCDTYYNQDIVSQVRTENSYFVTKVDADISHEYTMFEVVNDRIVSMKFKESVDSSWLALTGVMYIHDWQQFKDKLYNHPSPEIIWTIPLGSRIETLDTWLDFGNAKIYTDAVQQSQKYNFTKPDEITYICNNRVVKWWKDSTVAQKKYIKSQTNPSVYPNHVDSSGQWIAYDYFTGTTLYEHNDPAVFEDLLQWLDQEVWVHQLQTDITQATDNFYKIKTLGRINKFLEKYPNLPSAKTVDGVAVREFSYYLNNIDWSLLTNTTLPGYMHGDLQFDNVIISNDNKFKVIDWRHEFADIVEIGDIYYDLAKLMGGFIINYSDIKNNNFTVTVDNGDVSLSVPGIENSGIYIDKLKQFIINKGWSYTKVRTLIPIIFWNMSPLHTPPFDQLLWYLGIKLFEELEL